MELVWQERGVIEEGGYVGRRGGFGQERYCGRGAAGLDTNCQSRGEREEERNEGEEEEEQEGEGKGTG